MQDLWLIVLCQRGLQVMMQAPRRQAAPSPHIASAQIGRGCRRRVCRGQVQLCSALTPDLAFTVVTAFLVPTYGALMVSRRLPTVHKALTSHFVPLALGLAWVAALQLSASQTGTSIPHLLHQANSALLGSVSSISTLFKTKWFTLLCWLHLLMLDYLLAREIALDAAYRNVFAAHSIVLCFMCGPCGYLSHQITKGLYSLAGRDLKPAAVPA